MKKIGVLLFVFLVISLFSFAFAQDDMPSAPGGEDMEAIQGAVDQIPIEDGEIDKEKVSGFKSKAEERIEKINLWLKENAPWLEIVFGMVPEISWLFAINFYFMLLFLVILVLNNNLFSFFVSEKLGMFAGLGVYLILLITKVYFNLANVVLKLFTWFWNWGWIIALILCIIVGIIFVVLLIYAPQVLLMIKKWIDAKKEAKAKEETDVNRKALKKVVEGAVGKK